MEVKHYFNPVDVKGKSEVYICLQAKPAQKSEFFDIFEGCSKENCSNSFPRWLITFMKK